ncbi:MAG: UDP-glucose 4-epimerase GalE [Phycisphaerae bacterium]|nr:UDP-glucose 4-epimerase GalE [Phycisphaerae bacterium]
MNILVTGGAGYIGTHACKRLLAEGHRVVVIDNLFRGHEQPLKTLCSQPGVGAERLVFQKGDVGDRTLVEQLLRDHRIDAVMHFAALAYVRESMENPLAYYRANTAAAVSLLEACEAARVDRLVFSSTCATYGEPPADEIPIRETCRQQPINPYGWSKLFIERMILDDADMRRRHGKPFAAAMLRYFNVAGCDRAGLIGEDHTPETHIIPIMLEVALGKREALTVFGTDHPTPDGTCVRDYIHVEDLVDAHAAVLKTLDPAKGDVRSYNLGTGRGHSIREVLASVERVTGKSIRTIDGPRHPGDPPTLFCDPGKIKREIGWSASIRSIDEMVESAWKWFRDHPRGYQDA